MDAELLQTILDQAIGAIFAVYLLLRIEKKLDTLIEETQKLVDTLAELVKNGGMPHGEL